MKKMFDLSGKKAIVTGGTRGICAETARELAANGADVLIVGRDCDAAGSVIDSVKKELNQSSISFFGGDVSDAENCEKIVNTCIDRYGGIDVLVNCAGVMSSTPIEELTVEEWDLIVRTNLNGTFFMIQKAIPYLKESKNGRIINVSSNAGRMGGYENSQAYTASKGGINAITWGIARKLAPLGITVNVVCPGTTITDMGRQYDSETLKRLTDRIPLGRLGKPEDTAAAICFLASDEAGFITGATLDINGGMYMG